MTSHDSPLPPSERLAVLRILDANHNRTAEGLRVVEEYARFVLNDSLQAGELKQLRHDLAGALALLPMDELLRARDTPHDVGTQLETVAEYRRADILEVVQANIKRVEQSLRAIEEYGKVLSPELARGVEQIRYRAYAVAKTLTIAAHRPQQLASARLYVLIDGGPDLDTFVKRARQLVDGGVEMLQLRDKQLTDHELLQRARSLREVTHGRCLFIMNDRPDLAVLSAADGVHVGQDELPVAAARSILGPRGLIGVSTHSLAQAQQAVRDGADYIGCGPTFPSSTKTFAEFPGVAFLAEVAANISLPAFAIGGITLDNIGQVRAAGLARAAVSGAITQAADLSQAINAFRAALAP